MPYMANAIQRLMGETYLPPSEDNPMFANWINDPRTQRELWGTGGLMEWPGLGPAESAIRGAAPIAIAMTRPEFLESATKQMMKTWGKVDPKTYQALRSFIERYPEKALDALKWMREVPGDVANKFMRGKYGMPLLGRYWPKQTTSLHKAVVHKTKEGKWIPRLEMEEFGSGLLKDVEGAGFAYRAPTGLGQEEFAGTAIHEPLHHLANYLGIKDVEKDVVKAEKALRKGEPSEYFDHLLDLFERSEQIRTRKSMAPAAQAIERLKTEELIPRIKRQLAEAKAKGDKYYIKKFEDQLRRAKKGAETGQWESELGEFAPDVTGIMVP